jgi:hypothetical protein
MNSLRQRMTSRSGGCASMISPESATRPSGNTRRHDEPAFQADSPCTPNQYCLITAGSVSAFQSLSGVVRM